MTQDALSPRSYRVADLRKGDRISGGVFLVEASNFKQTRNQKYFIQMALRDSSGSVRALVWEATAELYRSFQVGDFLRIDGRVEEFQNQRQVVIDQLVRESPELVDYGDFLPATARDFDEMDQELRQAIGEIRRAPLRDLLLAIIDDPEIRPHLRSSPAGKTLHHACIGGLLEHICSLIGASRQLARHYAELDRDLLYAAAILHDIGKVRELSCTGAFEYTDEGQLLGHIGIGLVLVDRKAQSIPGFPRDLLLEIQHIIASHHGLPEHGALKLPMTAEAIAFHYLDNLDAKLSTLSSVREELETAFSADEVECPQWSEFKPHLGRKLFFPRRNGNSS